MTTPNRPERESDESWEPGRDISESSNDPARLTGGAWLSLALSLAFFLSMVAIGMKYGVARHPRDKPAEAASTVLANAVASVPAPVVEAASMPTTPADDVNTLLARAHECASTAQWDCVIEATSGVIAQRGNTPETKALLAQAMVKGGWVPGNTPAPAIKGNAHSMREVSTLPAEPKHLVRHKHHHGGRAVHLRYTANHASGPDDMSDIYRH